MPEEKFHRIERATHTKCKEIEKIFQKFIIKKYKLSCKMMTTQNRYHNLCTEMARWRHRTPQQSILLEFQELLHHAVLRVGEFSDVFHLWPTKPYNTPRISSLGPTPIPITHSIGRTRKKKTFSDKGLNPKMPKTCIDLICAYLHSNSTL